MRTDVLGVGFDDLTLEEAAAAGAALVEAGGFHYAVTPNPEFLLAAKHNPAFRQALLGADLVLADGVGVVYSAKILGRPLKGKVPGIDFAQRLLAWMARHGKRLFLLGAKPGVAELAAELSGNPLTDGLTLSGGEPFCQAAECAALARIARERGLNVWAYTGYTYERLLAGEVPDALALLEQVDVLVDGPFVEAEKSYAALFRGSANQRLIDVPKSLAAGAVVLWERPDPLAHFTRPES